MKNTIFSVFVLWLVCVMSCQAVAGTFSDMVLKTGKLELRSGSGTFEVTPDGKGLRLSGISGEKENVTSYFIGRVKLSQALDLRGKAVSFRASTTEDSIDRIVVLCFRFYNAGEDDMCLSYMDWGTPFLDEQSIVFDFHPGMEHPGMKFQPHLCGSRVPDKVTAIDFYIGTRTARIPIEASFDSFELKDAPKENSKKPADVFTLPWSEKPEYSNVPAKVQHPVGIYKKADIDRAKENIKRHHWAREQLNALRKSCDAWMKRDAEAIKFWISEEDSWFKCLCPNCGTLPEFAWQGRVLQPDERSIKCTKCSMVFPNEKYPENSTYTIETAHGKVKTIKYYHGKDQIAQGENFGPRYHISGVVNCVRLRTISSIESAALVYALTGEMEYAAKTRQVLLRLAEVYPNYSVKYRATAYKTPRDRYMGGKLWAWKFGDSTLMPRMLTAYSLTYNSGLYSDVDKVAIENGLAREIKWLYTAWPPTKDFCTNAVPAHMTVTAMAAAVLGDHDLMDWVLKGTEGFPAFVRKYYERDGHWHEHTPSYAGMATAPMENLVRILQGYKDSVTYTGNNPYDGLDVFALVPELDLVFTGMLTGVLPSGKYPATNDSTASAGPSLILSGLAAQLSPNKRNVAIDNYLNWRLKSSATPGRKMLFFREPDYVMEENPAVPEEASCSRIFPGGGWVFLRRPESYMQSCAMILTTGAKSHDHQCTLDLSISDFGRDMASDLGYLSAWHPYANWLRSILAHNLVVVENRPQSKRRFGFPELFACTGDIQAARVSAPSAYPGKAKIYERTVFNIPLQEGKRQYIADFFRVSGGREHLWVFHADGERFDYPDYVTLKTAAPKTLPDSIGGKWLENVRQGQIAAGTHVFSWHPDDKLRTRSFCVLDSAQKLLFAEGLGLRTLYRPYEKPKLNLLMLQNNSRNSCFAQVVECDDGKPLVRSVRELKTAGRQAKALEIVTAQGTDIVVVADKGDARVTLPEIPGFSLRGRSAVVRLDGNGKLYRLWTEGGACAYGNTTLECPPPVNAVVKSIEGNVIKLASDNWPMNFSFDGMYFSAIGKRDGAYRMLHAVADRQGNVTVTLDPKEVIRLAPQQQIVIFPYRQR